MTRMTAGQAYARAQKLGGVPRQTEARALFEAATRLRAIKEEPDNFPKFDEALIFNLRLWNTLMADALDASNPLPVEIKSNLLNLFHFIDRQTVQLLSKRDPEKLDTLISINREIAQGLLQ